MYGAVLGEKKNILKSSKGHLLVTLLTRNAILEQEKLGSLMRYIYNLMTDEHRNKYLRFLRLFSRGISRGCEYNSQAHKGNCTKYSLRSDVEKNGSPVMQCLQYLDPTENNTLKSTT